jgi:hypothetical protein
MHTDEYEISLGREITFCRKKVRRLQDALEKRERQWGMTTAAFLQAQEEGCLSGEHPTQDWKQEFHDLCYWQKTLAEYEAVLESLKWL